MRYKQARVCGTCRAHKLGCDGKRPSCSQCTHTGRKCAGYRSETAFVSYTPRGTTKPPTLTSRTPPAVSIVKAVGPPMVPDRTARNTFRYSIPKSFLAMTVEDFASIIVNCYVPVNQQNRSMSDTSTNQVCGAWVNVLPKLVHEQQSCELVTSAVRTLGAAILERTPAGDRIAFQNFEVYHSALYHLRDALMSPERFLVGTAAAISCLVMSELLFSTSRNASSTHLAGLGALIESHKPEEFGNHVFHAIFVGTRPLLMFQAFFTRKSTFLAQKSWKEAPFCHIPPSDMQRLLSDVVRLPSIMEEIDMLRINFDSAVSLRALTVKLDVLSILECLMIWRKRFENRVTAKPTSLDNQQDPDRPNSPNQSLWFPDLLTANVNLHIWAFELICFSEIEKLDSIMNQRGYHIKFDRDFSSKQDVQIKTMELAVKICQSLEYLLQDEMRLYGPASAIFPLQIAYGVLSQNPLAEPAQAERCRDCIMQIRHKGYQARLPL